MITIAQALAQILEQAAALPPTRLASIDAAGLVLAKDIRSDVDSPPHDKAMVDGYAMLSADVGGGPLLVLEEITAGKIPTREVTAGRATRIMTGAPLPLGADCVVMVERTRLQTDADGGERVVVDDASLTTGANIMPKASSLSKGEVVLRKGGVLRPLEVGLLAEVGAVDVLVHRRPNVAILATGDELTPAAEAPKAGCIRNSNGPMLAALTRRVGATPIDVGIGRDRIEHLRKLVSQGLENDVLLLSGGVSAGVLDLVPQVLQELKVRQVFHKVRLKPGKPLWFGVTSEAPQRLVFGLPGNPVSSMVCFELFVRPALDRLLGRREVGPPRRWGSLAAEHTVHGDRPTYHPATFSADNNTIQLLDWRGSADVRGLTDADCLACFPEGNRTYVAGSELEVIFL